MKCLEKNSLYTEIICSRENPKIKLYRKLAGSKKERLRYKLFTLEGERLIFDAIKSGAAISQIFLAESAAEKFADKLPDDIKVCVVSDSISKYISSTENTQGIFAVCSFVDKGTISGKLKNGGRYAVLYALQDPGNAGTIVRTADALGLDGIIFCESCDVYNPKTVRAAMGAMFRIPVFRDVACDELFSTLESSGIKTFAAVVDKDADDISKMKLKNGGAVFIGNEGSGLDEKITARCSQKITIKMTGNAESLNAAMAAGIIMWELMKCE